VFQRHARPPDASTAHPGASTAARVPGPPGVDPDGDRKPGPHVKPAIEDHETVSWSDRTRRVRPPPAAGNSCPTAALPFYPQAAMQLTDGSVMLQEVTSSYWWRVRPDASGSYLNATFTRTPPMPNDYAPTYPCRAVCPTDGCSSRRRVQRRLGRPGRKPARGAIYDPVANSWQTLAPPPGYEKDARIGIGDQSCVVMPNGQMLLAGRGHGNVFQLDPSTLQWTALHPAGKLGGNDSSEEENWTLLTDGTIFTVDVSHPAPPSVTSRRGSTIPSTAGGSRPAPRRAADRRRVVRDRTPGPASRRHRARHRGHRRQRGLPPTGHPVRHRHLERGRPFTDSAGNLEGLNDGTASVLPNGDTIAFASPGVYQRPTTDSALPARSHTSWIRSCQPR